MIRENEKEIDLCTAILNLAKDHLASGYLLTPDISTFGKEHMMRIRSGLGYETQVIYDGPKEEMIHLFRLAQVVAEKEKAMSGLPSLGSPNDAEIQRIRRHRNWEERTKIALAVMGRSEKNDLQILSYPMVVLCSAYILFVEEAGAKGSRVFDEMLKAVNA